MWSFSLSNVIVNFRPDFRPCLKLDLGNMIKCELGSFRLEQMLTFSSLSSHVLTFYSLNKGNFAVKRKINKVNSFQEMS